MEAVWEFLKREGFGVLASLCMFIGLSFKTRTFKGTIFMRVFNILADLFFIVYGITLNGVTMIVANTLLAILNIFYLIKEIIYQRKKLRKNEQNKEQILNK